MVESNTEMMLMENVMPKYILVLNLIIASLLASCNSSHAQQSDHVTESSSVSDAKKVDEIVVKMDGNRKTSISTHISSISDTMFCDGHKILAKVKYKIDFDGDNEFVTHELDISVNGEEVETKKFDSKLQKFKHFGFDFTCREDKMYLDLLGYNDNVDQSGSVVLNLNIDKKRGKEVIIKATF